MIRAARSRLRESQDPGEKGFTIVEVLVAGLVLVVGLIFIAQLFTSSASRVLASDTRSLMHQIATQEIETIRAMQYVDVGTIGGQPVGALWPIGESAAKTPRVVQGRSFLIVREVTYIQDSSYSGPFPANYRRATVKVYLATSSATDPMVGSTHVSSALSPVEMSTNVAGGALGGTLDITVSALSGTGVPAAQLTITDTVLVPNVLINASAIRTDNDGKLMVPGLTPDPGGGYNVQATKDGYNPAALKQNVVVVNGTPFTVGDDEHPCHRSERRPLGGGGSHRDRIQVGEPMDFQPDGFHRCHRDGHAPEHQVFDRPRALLHPAGHPAHPGSTASQRRDRPRGRPEVPASAGREDPGDSRSCGNAGRHRRGPIELRGLAR
jgi:hypothetical protein